MYKRILAPTEGSDTEKPAVLVAATLAQRFGAELHLVRVETPPVVVEAKDQQSVLAITEETLREERGIRAKRLDEFGAELRTINKGLNVLTSLETGQVAPLLREYAERHEIDLIVMSSHARGGLKRIALGSVTDYLARHTNVPVLVVKPSGDVVAAGQNLFRNIVVPLDGSGDAEQILPEVATIAAQLGATVNLLQVLTPLTYSQQQIMQPGMPWWDTDIAVADSYLSRATAYFVERKIPANKYVLLSEDIAAAILDYANRTRADLIAIATSGKGGIKRFVFGTIADEVTRKFACSVLVFHPKVTAGETPGEYSAANAFAGG